MITGSKVAAVLLGAATILLLAAMVVNDQQGQQQLKQWGLRHSRFLMLDPKTIDVKTDAGAAIAPHWSFDPDCLRGEPWNDCTPEDHLRWPHATPHTCQDLLDKGIHRIIFLGDSYVRHAYIATMMHLSNNYKHGALKDEYVAAAAANDPCFYGAQFEEVECRKHLRLENRVCDGHIKLVRGSWSGMWVPFQGDFLNKYDAIVWSGGNHPVDKNYTTRYGVYDAAVISKEILEPQCGTTNDMDAMNRKVVWLDTHARQCHGSYCHLDMNPDETLGAVERFHKEMPSFLKDVCGITKIASVWDASYELVTKLHEEAETMTFDRVHWGMQLNLLKAHEILRQIMS